MKTIYNILVSLLIAAMKIGAVFNYKLKKGLAGRRQSCEIVKAKFSGDDKIIWMHAASLGEYEQGLPVLEKLKKEFPEHKILVTFFSPSGYDHIITKKSIADAVCYLPFDTDKWVKEFTSNFKTDIFFTVKYDFWYNLLGELKKQGAEIYVVSALFYETQVFFKFYGKWFVKQLRENVDFFFHQTTQSSALAKSIGLKNSITAGDTRYDRVKQLRERDNMVPYIDEFIGDQKTVIFGSSWEAEERIAEILSVKNRNLKIIIAPHDLKRVSVLQTTFPTALLYSQFSDKNPLSYSNIQVLIIDCIGLLGNLYSYGDLAIVGGGFHSKGLHNILEAATYGIPVFFGDQFRKNPEADGLIAHNGGKCFEDEFFAAPYLLGLLNDDVLLKKMGENAANFINSQPNASENIVDFVVKNHRV
ncbi:3-deoxy-D-manno-octulosonic-acid transferase [Kaistella treverensis]|uniref:3-deoxy-D-manno-octulosonic acid transferase n=1 Tax=Kaistella treverensis TaxID=631455 RepID=A0A1I3MBU6_9FLAO|nr:glycosyltransferase N-terminal domain-containing protein [Kaistella treverensis]SFI94471.1 3-deoxy-D-manno-octulosonic-acid transferase [Kaistella treverensis]